MSNAREVVEQVQTIVAGSRISKERTDDINRKLALLRNGGPVSTEHIYTPDDCRDQYYVKSREAAGERNVRKPVKLYPSVRAVRIDSDVETEGHGAGRRPSSWRNAVELSGNMGADVLGDLTKEQAIKLAGDLLAAAQLLD